MVPSSAQRTTPIADAQCPSVDVWDDRPAAVFVHGSFAADPAYTWAKQRLLAANYRLLILHRRGYGRAIPRVPGDFTQDTRDVAALLGEGSHLVGFSYGGLIALLAAASNPRRIRSLTLIEPPAFSIARDHPAVRTLIQRLASLYPSDRYSPEEYRVAFLRAIGGNPPQPLILAAEERQAVLAAMAEAPPWEAPLDLRVIAEAPFPKLVVSGAWNEALDAVAAELRRQLRTEVAIIPGAGHTVQQTGEPFNRRLLVFWREAEERGRRRAERSGIQP